jgi:hypothetical protein
VRDSDAVARAALPVLHKCHSRDRSADHIFSPGSCGWRPHCTRALSPLSVPPSAFSSTNSPAMFAKLRYALLAWLACDQVQSSLLPSALAASASLVAGLTLNIPTCVTLVLQPAIAEVQCGIATLLRRVRLLSVGTRSQTMALHSHSLNCCRTTSPGDPVFTLELTNPSFNSVSHRLDSLSHCLMTSSSPGPCAQEHHRPVHRLVQHYPWGSPSSVRATQMTSAPSH